MERWRKYRHPGVYQTRLERIGRVRRIRLAAKQVRLAAFGVGVLACWWLVGVSPMFRIEKVILKGETTEAMNAAVERFSGRNLISLSEEDVFALLSAIDPSVATVGVAKGFPRQLELLVSRRHPALVWQVGDERWALADDGIVFPFDPTTASGRPTIIDRRAQPVVKGQRLVSPEFVKFVTGGAEHLPPMMAGRLVLGEIDETTFQLVWVTEWGWKIILDTTRPLAGQLANLELVLRDHRQEIREYVDLRLEGWAYLK